MGSNSSWWALIHTQAKLSWSRAVIQQSRRGFMQGLAGLTQVLNLLLSYSSTILREPHLVSADSVPSNSKYPLHEKLGGALEASRLDGYWCRRRCLWEGPVQ